MKKKITALILAIAMLFPLLAMPLTGWSSSISAAPTENIPLSTFSLHKDKVNLDIGKTATLSIPTSTIQPPNTTSTMDALWSSDNPDIVTMTGKAPGQIKALRYGTATITCEIDGIKAHCVVTVSSKEKPVTGFSLHLSTIAVGVGYETVLMPAEVSPIDASNIATAKWFSSNIEVIQIDTTGKIRALKPGYSTVTCQIGTVKAYCKVTVNEAPPIQEQGHVRIKVLGNNKVRPSESFYILLHEIDDYGRPGALIDVLVSDALGMVHFQNSRIITGKQYFVTEFLSDTLKQKYADPQTLRVTAQKADSIVDVMFNNPLRSPVEKPENLQLIEVTKSMFDIAGDEHIDKKVKLFDEFEKVSANPPNADRPYIPPINSSAKTNANTWRSTGAGWLTDPYETVAKFDMRREWQIFEIYVFDGAVYAPSTYTEDGSAAYEVMGGSVKIYAGDLLLATQVLTNSEEWILIDLTEDFGVDGITTQQLRIVKEQDLTKNRYSWTDGSWTSAKGEYVCDVNITELAMFGLPLGEDPEPEIPWELLPADRDPIDYNYTIGQFMGTNSLAFDDLSNYDNLSLLREYHMWGWTEHAGNDQADAGGNKNASAATENPDVRFINSWGHFDAYYRNIKAKGIEVVMCIQGGVQGYPTRPNFQGDKDPKKASSYLAHGQSLFQHAARYGSNKDIDPSLVKVASGTTKEIGLDYVKYYENWNEPNLGTFTGAQFAAMTSADYDGHMGTMGPDVGIKQADPNAVFVLGGLAYAITETKYSENDTSCLEFVMDMLKWFDLNRTEEQWLETHANLDGYVKYPFDVLSCHYYCPDGIGPTGLSPEDDHVLDRMREFVSFCETYLPEVEVWLSEFGWDTNQGSPQSATAEYQKNDIVYNQGINPGLTGEEVQGRWLVREYLILAAAGIDRVQQFMLGDDNSASSNRFASSGMIGANGKKASWYYVGTMRYYLDSTVFEKELETTHPDVMAYQFTETDPAVFGSKVLAVWAKTSINQTIEAYQITLPEGVRAAQLITLTAEKWGTKTMLDITDGTVTIDVSEKPVFIICMDEVPSYEIPAEIPGVNFLFREHFDMLRTGPLSTKNNIIDLSYPLTLTAPEVVLPDESSPLYVGPNDQVLKISAQKVVGGTGSDFGNGDFGSGVTISADIARQMLPGHKYYFDYWFYCEETTTIPAVRYDAYYTTRYWLFANPVGGTEPGVIRGSAGTIWDPYASFQANTWNHIVVEYEISEDFYPLPEGQGTAYYMNGKAYFNDMTTPACFGTPNYTGYRAPYGRMDIFFTPWAIDHDNIAKGTAYINNLMIYESEIGIVNLNNTPPPVEYATAPSAVSLSPGENQPVKRVESVALPNPGDTDSTGHVYGWAKDISDTISFTVTDTAPAESTITIDGTPYISGTDYVVTNIGVLTIVLTTTEADKTTAVRTYKVSVEESSSAVNYLAKLQASLLDDGAFPDTTDFTFTYPVSVIRLDENDPKYTVEGDKALFMDFFSANDWSMRIKLTESVRNRIAKNKDYILDYTFWRDQEMPTPGIFIAGGNYADNPIAMADYHTGNMILADGVSIPVPTAQWNRLIMKFRWNTDNTLSYSIYLNDMESSLYTGLMTDVQSIQWLDIGFAKRYQEISSADIAYVKNLYLYEGIEVN